MSFKINPDFKIKSSEFYHKPNETGKERTKEQLRKELPVILSDKDFDSGLAKELGVELEGEQKNQFLKEQSWQLYKRKERARVLQKGEIERAPETFKLDGDFKIKFLKGLAVVLKIVSLISSMLTPFALFYCPTWVPWGVGLPTFILFGVSQFLINLRIKKQENYSQVYFPHLKNFTESLSFNPYHPIGPWDLKDDNRLKSDRLKEQASPSPKQIEEMLGFRSGRKKFHVVDCDTTPFIDIVVAERLANDKQNEQKWQDINTARIKAIAEFRNHPNQGLPNMLAARLLGYTTGHPLLARSSSARDDLERWLRGYNTFVKLKSEVEQLLDEQKNLYALEGKQDLLSQAWQKFLTNNKFKEFEEKLKGFEKILKKGSVSSNRNEKIDVQNVDQMTEIPLEEDKKQFEEKKDEIELIVENEEPPASEKEINEAIDQFFKLEIFQDNQENHDRTVSVIAIISGLIEEAITTRRVIQNKIKEHPQTRLNEIKKELAGLFWDELEPWIKNYLKNHPEKIYEEVKKEFDDFKGTWIKRDHFKALCKWMKKVGTEHWHTKCLELPLKVKFPKEVLTWLGSQPRLQSETPSTLYKRINRVLEQGKQAKKELEEIELKWNTQSLEDKNLRLDEFTRVHMAPLKKIADQKGETSRIRLLFKERFCTIPAFPFEKTEFSSHKALRMRQIEEIQLDNRLRQVDAKMWRTHLASRAVTLAPYVMMAVSGILYYLIPLVWPLFGVAVVNAAFGALGFYLDYLLKRLEEEKEDIKSEYVYRDRPILGPAPGDRPELKELQQLQSKYGLEGVRKTASAKKPLRDVLATLEKPREKRGKFLKKWGREIESLSEKYFEDRAISIESQMLHLKERYQSSNNQPKIKKRYALLKKKLEELQQIRKELARHKQNLEQTQVKKQPEFTFLERDRALRLKAYYEKQLDEVADKMILLKMRRADFEQKLERFEKWPEKIQKLQNAINNHPQNNPSDNIALGKKREKLWGLRSTLEGYRSAIYFSQENVQQSINEIKEELRQLEERCGLPRIEGERDPTGLHKHLEDAKIEVAKQECQLKKLCRVEKSVKEELLEKLRGQSNEKEEEINPEEVENLYKKLSLKDKGDVWPLLSPEYRDILSGDKLIELCSRAVKEEKQLANWWDGKKGKLKDLFAKIEPYRKDNAYRMLPEFFRKKLEEELRLSTGQDLMKDAENIEKEVAKLKAGRSEKRAKLWEEKKEGFIMRFKELDPYFQEVVYRRLSNQLQKLFNPFYQEYTGEGLRKIAQAFHDANLAVHAKSLKAFWLACPGFCDLKKYDVKKVEKKPEAFLNQWLQKNGKSLIEKYKKIDGKYEANVYAVLPESIQELIKN